MAGQEAKHDKIEELVIQAEIRGISYGKLVALEYEKMSGEIAEKEKLYEAYLAKKREKRKARQEACAAGEIEIIQKGKARKRGKKK